MGDRGGMGAIVALALFLLLHGVFFYDVVAGGRSLSASTLAAGLTPRGPVGAPAERPPPHVLDVEGAAWVDEPSPHLARRAFAAHELPLWNPASGLGAPLAANLNSGAANPLQLPLNLRPGPAAADAYHLGRLLLLALAVWAFLAALGVPSLVAAFGGAVVAYGGYPLAWIVHHPLASEVFLPLVLFGFEHGRRGRASGWMIMTLAAAGSLLGGKLQASLLGLGFVAAFAACRASPAEGGAGRRTLVAAGVGLGLAVAAAAVLLVPGAELVGRASGLTLGGRSALAGFTVPWPSLASLAVPSLFTSPDRVFADGLLTPAIGIGAVALAVVGAVAGASPFVRVARLGVLWAALLLLRNAGAFGELATALPVARGILFVKYTFTAVLALGVAAAIGLEAILAGRIEAARAGRAIAGTLAAIAALAAAAVVADTPAASADGAKVPLGFAAAYAGAALAWRLGRLGRTGVAAILALLVVAELWSFAPHRHPPRLDPYRAPGFVAFLRTAAPGRVIADADLAVPLTSAAAGLADVRAIDVLTPGSYYAFFTRLVSFCDRVIHFTVDPDVALAATAPALDLAGARWIVSRQPLPPADLPARVRRQVGRERTARLLAGLVALASEGEPFAIGPIAAAGEQRFAFTLTTPFTLDVTAESEAPELAWGVLVRGAGAGVVLDVRIDGVPADAPRAPLALPPREAWHEARVALARAGERRRIRLRLAGRSRDDVPVRVSIGDLGFGGGALAERRLAAERAERHTAEASALRPAYRDPATGVVVWENTNVLPRAFRVRHVEPTASEDAALTRLGDGFDFRRGALVATADVEAVRRALGAEPAGMEGRGDDAGTAAVVAETPGRVAVATSGAAPALLILADLAFPGWRADVDGTPATVLTVDGVLRGVVVPAGTHRVTFRYRPTSWLVGALASVLALAGLVPYGRRAARAHDGAGA